MKITFTYVGIRVKDMAESVSFYTEVLGMKEVGRSRITVANGDAVNLVSDDGGFNLELNSYDKGSKYDADYVIGEGLDHLAFQTENLDKFLEEVKAMGYPVAAEMKTEKSRWVYIVDPNGIWIELF
jgi:lactoylglutathione lyase